MDCGSRTSGKLLNANLVTVRSYIREEVVLMEKEKTRVIYFIVDVKGCASNQTMVFFVQAMPKLTVGSQGKHKLILDEVSAKSINVMSETINKTAQSL